VSPLQNDGTCCEEGSPETRRRRAFWTRVLVGCFIFGGLFMMAAMIFISLYFIVKVLR